MLRREGKKRGFRVFPDNDKRFATAKSQWLFDLIWWNNGTRGKGVELAVECEWNSDAGAVVHDFEKLLTVKSPLKLMIYRARPKTRRQVREDIRKYLETYGQHVTGERYLICEFLPNSSCYSYMFRVKTHHNGRVSDVKFRTVFEC